MNLQNNFTGFHYFVRGCRLITKSGVRRFVILPLIANIFLIGGMFYWLYEKFGSWIPALMQKIPDWLQWLDYILWPLIILSVLFVFGYFFSILANFIASPFNALLAEKVENMLTGRVSNDSGYISMLKDIPRTLRRELNKLTYFLPRAGLLLIFYFVPVIGQTILPILWFIFSTWMISLQYCDYCFDNHKIAFADMKYRLKSDRVKNIQFGTLVYLFTLIPFLNLIIMPVAVCGATAMWVDRYRDNY